tara:strand:- start:3741 stop:4076 length:336 start_codon:yes stop_codon:yes gene_type:complete
MNPESENGSERPQKPPKAAKRQLAYLTPTHQPNYEKSPLRSKKFLGFFFSEMMWKALIVTMIVAWESAWVGHQLILATVIASATVQMAYLCSQAWIDRSVRLAEIENAKKQ